MQAGERTQVPHSPNVFSAQRSTVSLLRRRAPPARACSPGRSHRRGRDDHVAAVVERTRASSRLAAGDVVSRLRPFIQATAISRPGSMRRIRAEQIDVADPLELLVVRHARGAIAEADLGPHKDGHLGPQCSRRH